MQSRRRRRSTATSSRRSASARRRAAPRSPARSAPRSPSYAPSASVRLRGIRHLQPLPIAREALPRLMDLLDSVLAREPAVHRDALLLEVLVDREEVGDLVLQLLVEVVERLALVPRRVGTGHREHLVVDPLIVLHPEQRDRLDLDQTAGEGR